MLDHKDGWNPEAFRGRYSEVLERYDFIIGDWGYSQLRLKGFFRDNHPKVNRDTAISGMVDYINEYCNFGCAYFVLHKLKETPKEGEYKDILIKEVSEPAAADETKPEQTEPAAPVRVHREAPNRSEGRNKDGGPGKERPVREHQSRNHRNKDAQGKKHHKESQNRQHNQKQSQNQNQNQNNNNQPNNPAN